MDQSTNEVRMAYWLTIAKQCQNRPNGQSARQWLDRKEEAKKFPKIFKDSVVSENQMASCTGKRSQL